MMGYDAPDQLGCSRAGCSEPASWQVQWRNPRIHATDKVKVWLACQEHRDFLRDYLATRDFPVAVVPLDTSGAVVQSLPLDPILTVDTPAEETKEI